MSEPEELQSLIRAQAQTLADLQSVVHAQAKMIGELLAWIVNDELDCTREQAQHFLIESLEDVPPEVRRHYFAPAFSLHHLSATGDPLD